MPAMPELPKQPWWDRLRHPVKVYCLWCGAETYGLYMTCGRCAYHTCDEWLHYGPRALGGPPGS